MCEPSRPAPGRDWLPQRPGTNRRARIRPWHWRLLAAVAVVVAGIFAFIVLPEEPSPAPEATRPGTTVAGDSVGSVRYAPPVLLGVVSDAVISESSGLAASGRDSDVLWTHNDSGDGPFVYCIDFEASPCGVWEVAGASARDWEDMAAGPGPDPSLSYLYLGDIGDNDRGRDDVTVHRVPEPAVDEAGRRSTRARPAMAAGSQALVLRYPDGPHDAEALLVHPGSGDLYVVTKELSGQAGVYRASAPLDPTTTMEAVATLAIPGQRGDPAVLVTGGDIAPDGSRVVLSTYTQALELDLPTQTGEFDAVWQQPPTPVPLAPRQQGEAIAYRSDGAALLATSEGSPAPLHQVTRVERG